MTQREQQVLKLIQADPMISQQAIADALGITRSSAAVHISNLMKKGYITGKGYVLRPETYVVVVGGVNVDIGGRSYAPLVEADSNPGTVTISMGGVGRNIAHNMCLMDVDVRFLTAYGDDLNGQRFVASCSELGIDISRALKVMGEATSSYLYLADHHGEMALAISDMQIAERITPEYLATNLSLLQGAQVVVADTNIPEASLKFLAENCTTPLFVDPVSTTKAQKLLPVLSSIHTLKPNILEAALLSGIPIETDEDVEKAAAVLLDKGVKRVFITMGPRGVYAAQQAEQYWIPNISGNMVNTTGCGDAFTAALVWAYLEDKNLKDSALAGLAAGSIAMESQETINSAMNITALKNRAYN